jgi:hypothetical protein
MTIFDRFRATSARLFDAFGTPATITSPGARTSDFITGNVTTGSGSSKAVLAALGKRRLVADDGTITIQSVAKANGSANAGDTLTIGTKVFMVSDVEEVAPDGGTPMLWILVLS